VLLLISNILCIATNYCTIINLYVYAVFYIIKKIDDKVMIN